MRMHKMEAGEIKAANEFVDACELMLEREKFSFEEPYESWQNLDEDDEDRKEIESLKRQIASNDDVDIKDIDPRVVAYEYLKRKYSYRAKVAVITSEILIDHCCDPTKTYLDFHPSFYQNHVEPEQ